MRRRHMILGTAGLVAAGGAGWLGLTDPAAVKGFADRAAVDAVLNQLLTLPEAPPTIGWPLPQVIAHCAQSIEFSLTGYPQPKPAWFRSTLGPTAFAVFERRGAMRHNLEEAIPGAPDLGSETQLSRSIARLRQAWDAFEAHTGAYQPHFAYGVLGKDQYRRAHLMHHADHWQRVG